jgi:hypothetical protein
MSVVLSRFVLSVFKRAHISDSALFVVVHCTFHGNTVSLLSESVIIEARRVCVGI